MTTPIELPTLTCKRCNHKWIPRTTQLPTTCPKCKSPYWNKPRKKKVKNNEWKQSKTRTTEPTNNESKIKTSTTTSDRYFKHGFSFFILDDDSGYIAFMKQLPNLLHEIIRGDCEFLPSHLGCCCTADRAEFIPVVQFCSAFATVWQTMSLSEWVFIGARVY